MSVIGVHIVRLFGMELSRHTLARACLSAVVVSGGLVPFHFRKHLPVWVRVACLALIFASIGICCVWNFRIMRSHIENPPEWDFRVFWMYGKVLARHGNVYLPSEYQEFKELFQSDTQFTEASLNVGATYPPHSMLLFEPLGFSNIHTAYLLWYVLQTAALLLPSSCCAEYSSAAPVFGAWDWRHFCSSPCEALGSLLISVKRTFSY